MNKDIIKCTDKLICFEENGRKITFNNLSQHEVIKYRVDNGLIKTGIRCDYKLDCPSFENYIELKGCDVIHACKQIEESIKQISRDVSKSPKKSFIIISRFPSCHIVSGRTQLNEKHFKKNFNSSLLIKVNRHLEVIP